MNYTLPAHVSNSPVAGWFHYNNGPVRFCIRFHAGEWLAWPIGDSRTTRFPQSEVPVEVTEAANAIKSQFPAAA